MTNTQHPFAPVDVSVVLVVRDARTRIAAALAGVDAEARATPFEIVIACPPELVDTIDRVSEKAVRTRIVPVSDTSNFARAANLAALQSRGRYLLLLDADARILNRGVERLMDFARRHPSARIWGGAIVDADRRGARSARHAAPMSERTVDVVSASFFLVESALWRGLHGLDPLFPVVGADADFCLRARAFSARPMIASYAELARTAPSTRPSADRAIASLAADAMLMDRHWSDAAAIVARAVRPIAPLANLVGASLLATLTFGVKGVENHALWSTVWRRRNEWRTTGSRFRRRTPMLPGVAKSAK